MTLFCNYKIINIKKFRAQEAVRDLPGAGQAWVVLTACLVDQLRAGFESTRDNYLEQIQIQQQLQQNQLNNQQQQKIIRQQQKQFAMENENQDAAIAATKLLMMRATATTTNCSQQQKFEENKQKMLPQNCECYLPQNANSCNLLENKNCVLGTTNYYDYNRTSNDNPYCLQTPLFNYTNNSIIAKSHISPSISPSASNYFLQQQIITSQNPESIEYQNLVMDSSQNSSIPISRLSLNSNDKNLVRRNSGTNTSQKNIYPITTPEI